LSSGFATPFLVVVSQASPIPFRSADHFQYRHMEDLMKSEVIGITKNQLGDQNSQKSETFIDKQQ